MLDVKEIRKDFPMLRNHPELIYFDNGATTYKPDCVIQAIVSFYENYTSNVARGEYATAVMADKAYAKARKTIAEFIHAEEKEIVFTANVTASLNQVAYGMRKWLNEGDVILTTKAEHASNLLPFYRLQKDLGIKINYIPVDAFGKIHIDDFKRMLNDKVKLVSIAEVSNVIGVTQEVKELIQLAHQVNALVCIDAAQSIGHMPIDVKDLDVDFLCYSSHKMCGPDGVGVLYGKKRLLEEMEPLMLGGGMNARFSSNGDMIYKNAPEKFEAGTPNIEGVIGLEKATEYLMQIGMDNIHEYERELRT
ncbi:MAG: aminotransferase class V-fold PLP-dependent enzyme, partial [Solobacterium sp.]|nr:aminotransferase class V-fold PLP-dependent enzyme [Solobacterium sp.]